MLSAASVVATLWLAKKKIAAWYLWVIVDFFSVGLYLKKDLKLIAFEYFLFGIMAIFAIYKWKQNETKNAKMLVDK